MADSNDFPPELDRGPKFIQVAFNALRGWSIRKHIADVSGGGSLTETEAGTSLEAGNGSGGGEDNLETITGAVNGVPATLRVQTDGEGWTEI